MSQASRGGSDTNWKKVVSWIVDGATLLVFFFAAWNVGRNFMRTKSLSPQTAQPRAIHLIPNASVRLTNTDWAANRSTLILVLSTSCHFCRESQDFYRRLVKAIPPGKLHLMAVFPEPLLISQPYLDKAGLDILDVRQVTLEELGVPATPTIILADQTGRMVSSWVGKLFPDQEKEIFASIGLSGVPGQAAIEQASPGGKVLSAAQLAELLQDNSPTVFLDTRERGPYKQAHLAGFSNIPLDELEVRSHHEFPTNVPVVVYCSYIYGCEVDKGARGVPTFCTASAFLLHQFGYPDVRLVGDTLEDLQKKGFSITRAPSLLSSRGNKPHL